MKVYKGKGEEDVAVTSFGEAVRVKRSRLTGIPDRVMQIEAYPAHLKDGRAPVTRQNAEATFKEFLREHKEVFGVEADDLVLASAKKINQRWYVKYGQTYKGIPVHNASVGVEAAEDGKVHSYAANYQPDLDVPAEPMVDLETAVETARKTYPPDVPKLRKKKGSLLIYPVEAEGKVSYHLAWKLLLAAKEPDPELEKYFIVDAMDGTIIHSYTANFPGAQVTGRVQGEVYPENPTDAVATMPMRNQYVEIQGEGQTTTNNSGDYSKTVSWWWQFFNWPFGQAKFTLRGPFARVQSNTGANYTENSGCSASSPCNLTWTAADRDHINLFHHMNLFHDWLADELGYAWTNPWDGSHRFNGQVNHTFNNAYAGNPMTFGTDNYARSSDVIYHECTHNVLYAIYGDYIGWPNNYTEAYAMDEGFADYFAGSFTDDPRHGEGYTANPRTLDNTTQYVGKSGFNSEGHSGGTIIAGAAWDLRKRLVRLYGATGARIVDQMILQAHQILATNPRDYYFSDPQESNLLTALYKAADSDNNLLNGFAYFYDIQLAFHAHGLLQAMLEENDSFDFSTNTIGNLTGGDLYYNGGGFWANNVNQKGVQDLGDIGDDDLAAVDLPTLGYTRFGVDAVEGHTYVSMAQEGEQGSYIVFRVTDISANQSQVAIRYLYRYSPYWYLANLRSKEIHKLDCHWVSLMSLKNKYYCASLGEAAPLIRDQEYNGCHYCLKRYDTDRYSREVVLAHLQEDLG